MASTEHKASGHQRIETSNFLMIVLVLLTVIAGGAVEIVPLFFQRSTTEAAPGAEALHAAATGGPGRLHPRRLLQLPLADDRPFRSETLRYGHYSTAGEFVYDHPFQWGSKRTGPDLHRVGGKYSDEWHRIHLNNPRDLVPESNMPAYPWLMTAQINPADMAPS